MHALTVTGTVMSQCKLAVRRTEHTAAAFRRTVRRQSSTKVFCLSFTTAVPEFGYGQNPAPAILWPDFRICAGFTKNSVSTSHIVVRLV